MFFKGASREKVVWAASLGERSQNYLECSRMGLDDFLFPELSNKLGQGASLTHIQIQELTSRHIR